MDRKIPYKLTFILPLIAMLTEEPEMLQPDAFCEHTMQQKCDCGWGGAYRVRGGEVDPNAQLEQGRRLAKAAPKEHPAASPYPKSKLLYKSVVDLMRIMYCRCFFFNRWLPFMAFSCLLCRQDRQESTCLTDDKTCGKNTQRISYCIVVCWHRND